MNIPPDFGNARHDFGNNRNDFRNTINYFGNARNEFENARTDFENARNDFRNAVNDLRKAVNDFRNAVNDFRKLANIECYTPTDNASELTARINDEGWDSSFANWLKVSNISSKDCLFFFSVGGGNIKKKISINLIQAAKLAKEKNCKIISIVGRDDGYLANNSDQSLIIPTVNKDNITPQSEAFQAIIWHLLVSHPKIKENNTKW